jgi:hypothetical protein
MDKNKAVGDNEGFTDKQRVEFWIRVIEAGGEQLFIDTILRSGTEDRPKPCFCRNPPSANKPGPPPPPPPPENGFSLVTVLALYAPVPQASRDQLNNMTPSTAAQGKKPRCTPTAPRRVRKEGSQDHTHARSLVQKPRRPSSTSEPGQAPQNSFKTVTVLCAPLHLAREAKRPSTSTECAPQGEKKHRAV